MHKERQVQKSVHGSLFSAGRVGPRLQISFFLIRSHNRTALDLRFKGRATQY